MDSTSIIDYIKKNYPKVVFTPFKFKETKALAFILSDKNLVIGFINANGTLCKLIEPIDISSMSSEYIRTIIQKIPVVNGFTDKDKTRLLRVFEQKEETISKQEHNQIVKGLEKRLSNTQIDKESEYKALFDSKSSEIVLIKKEYEDKIKIITDQYNDSLKQLDECRKQIVDQNKSILDGIEKYKESMKEFVASKDFKIEELEKIHKQSVEERKVLQERLDSILESEKKSMDQLLENKDLISDYDKKLEEKSKIVEELQNSMENVKNQLQIVNEELKKSQLENELLRGYKTRCRDKVLEEKNQIIDAIKKYNETWLSWVEKTDIDVKQQKRNLIEDFKKVRENLQKTMESQLEESNLSNKEVKRLNQNIKDIEASLQKTINDQLIELSKHEERLKEQEKTLSDLTSSKSDLEKELSNIVSERDKLSNIISEKEKVILEKDRDLSEKEQVLSDKEQSFISKEKSFKSQIDSLTEQNKRIPELQKELDELRLLLEKNRNTPIEVKIDYENCYSIITNFVALNNMFYRKQEIIKKLDDIINNNLGVFNNLNESMKQTLKSDFEKIKTEISNHIKFLNLSEYINSPNFEYLKSKATRSRVPESFCKDLSNLLEYWNLNKITYREQDIRLTNIYEDLSGAVRIYIRIKPLNSQKLNNTVEIKTVENKKTKGLMIDCSPNPNTKFKQKNYFGEFYGIFEEDFTNLDVYTGQRGTLTTDNSLLVDINNIIELSETISPGLYSTFKQVEQGYSIVLFGYGISGSGKSFTLIGSRGNPGVLHYGLANLEDVKSIRLKYLFEQSYYKINFNNRQLSGTIYNLVNQISQLKAFSIDETKTFEKLVPSYIDLKNLKVEDIYALTDIIEKYRIGNGRIKKTPNNPVSSRSHLYLVFEITFGSGKRGFVTVVDTAGRESPVDIFNTFLDSSKTSLASVMAPPPVGGVGNIEKNLLEEYRGVYRPNDILEILNEGFYINETINHLIYYFNLKNGKVIETPKQKIDKRYNVVYRVKSFFVQPQEEEKFIDGANNALMIPILKFLDNLSTKAKEEDQSTQDWKPTKFITICAVRQELNYCDQTTETLEFAQSVKSS